MKFFDYLESSYAVKNIEVQEKYSAFKHAETLAINDLTNGQRTFFKFLAYFKVIAKYLVVLSGFLPPLEDAKSVIKKMQEKKKAEYEKLKAEKEAQLAN